jgi:hypothetical protein
MGGEDFVATGIPARLAGAQERKFGLTIGTAFAALGMVAWWRGHHETAPVLAGLGAALLLAGVVKPTVLGPVERAWMGLARAMSSVTTPVFMGIVYLVILTPIGVLRRAFGSNPLAPASAANGSRWVSKAPPVRDAMEHQF